MKGSSQSQPGCAASPATSGAEPSAAFKLDTSGAVQLPGPLNFVGAHQASLVRWSDLDPFTQGYVEALFAESCGLYWAGATRGEDMARGFSDLAPETLAAILKDCGRWLERYPRTARTAPSGEKAWLYRQEQWVRRPDLPPLTPHLGDDGKVYLRESAQ